VHTAAIHLVPLLAAEKSKVPFYIAGGALVVWAVVVSVGLGLRKANFPGNMPGERLVITITVVLVLAAVSTAVLTAGTPEKAGAQGTAQTSATAPAGAAPAQAPPPPAATSTSSQPRATTGSPAPPSSPSAGARSTLKLAANPSGALSYDTKQLSGKTGKVTIDFTNSSPLEHNVTIAEGSKVLGATPTFTGSSKTLTLDLKPGTYTFYCSVPGHRQAGMEGTLTIS
jgi:plastocyanin